MTVRALRRGSIAASRVTAPAAVVPTFRASATGQSAGFGTSASVTIPGTVQAGDFMVVAVAIMAYSGQTVNTPSGWTAVRADTGAGSFGTTIAIFSRVAQAGDTGGAATVPVTTSASTQILVGFVSYSGGDAVDASGATVSASDGSALSAPSVSAPVASKVLRVFAATAGSPSTNTILNGPATQRTSQTHNGGYIGMRISDDDQAAAGATGTATANSNDGASSRVSITLAVGG